MSITGSPRVGVVAEDTLQLHRLRQAIEDFECDAITFSPDAMSTAPLKDYGVTAWLLDLPEDDELLERFIESDEVILLGFESAPSRQVQEYPQWEKRLYGKLKDILGHELPQPTVDLTSMTNVAPAVPLPFPKLLNNTDHAQHVWVLGSSMGGPEAVKEFLDALPAKLPVAFIYAQHINAHFVPVLADVLGRHAAYKLKVAHDGLAVKSGEVIIAPTDQEVDFVDGCIKEMGRPWPGPYGPSIDQLIKNTVQSFPHAGVILFSGMGNDGADAAQSLKEKGISIWAQAEESCVSAAMPNAARETGAVNYSATPQGLAKHLVDYIKEYELDAS